MLRSLAGLVLNSHLFIAFCVVCMWLSSEIAFGIPVAWTPEVVLLFMGTVCYYNLHKAAYSISDLNPMRWSFKELSGKLSASDHVATLLAGTVFIATAFSFRASMSRLWLIVPVFPFLYSLPVVVWSKRDKRFRERPVLKLITIATCYTVTTVLIPLDAAGHSAMDCSTLVYGSFSFIFIAALCVPFEIRDEQKEINRSVPTLLRYGSYRIRQVTYGIILLVSALVAFGWKMDWLHGYVCAAMLLSLGVSTIWVAKARSDWPDWYFKFGVDGTMVLHFIFLIFLKQWH